MRKFAERSSSAGEFFTPADIGFLIERLLDSERGDTVYDPACGSAGLLVKTQLRHRVKLAASIGKPLAELDANDDPNPLLLYGQEIQADNVASGKMNSFIHDMGAEVRQDNIMSNPLFTQQDGSLRHFRKLAANPMWNQV